MHLRAEPIRLLHRMLGDVGRLILGNLKELLHPPTESGEVGLSSACVGLVHGLAELVIVGHQRVVLLQKPSDLGMRRSYEMIDGFPFVSFAGYGKAAVIRRGVNSGGHVHAGSLHAKVPLPRVISG